MKEFVEIPEPSRFRLGELFSNNNFVVPLYQRSYAWELAEINDFWDDLKDLIDGRSSSHFFGQIVTYRNDDGDQEIIDGQQRITTSTLFMAVLRDVANELYNELFKQNTGNAAIEIGVTLRGISQQVDGAIRGKEHPSLIVQKNQVAQDESLQDFFYALTNSGTVVNKKTTAKPKKNMQQAYKKMTSFVQGVLGEQKEIGGQIDQLKLMTDSFFKRFYIVMISAPSRQDAFMIFETLNSRGKDLKASDIIKNHLMSLMMTDMQEANRIWGELATQLNEDSNEITKFIRTYWASRKRVVPEKKLYREVSAKVENLNEAQKFLEDLKSVVSLYTVLQSPTVPKEHDNFFANRQIIETLNILKRLGVKLYYPVIVAMYHKGYSETGILMVINKLLAVFIRHRAIIYNGTNKLENGFSDVAHKIWEMELTSVDEIIAELNGHLLPSDEATRASFNVLTKSAKQGISKWTLIYLLSQLYAAEYDDFKGNLYRSTFKYEEYTLIQIDTNTIAADRQNYLGNWTLLEKKLVIEEADQARDWIPVLEKSGLIANRRLAREISQNGWSMDSIKQRQERFSRSVTIIW